MLKLDSTHHVIDCIHRYIDCALEDLWFNVLPVTELTDIDNGLITLTKQVIMKDWLALDNVLKNLLLDPALSYHLNANVYYFWGEENKSVFDLAGKTHTVALTDDIDCIAFRFDEDFYVFVHYDELVNKNSAQEACEAVQHDWFNYQLDNEIIWVGEHGEHGEYNEFHQKTIPFIIAQLYRNYDFMVQYCND